MTLKDLEAGDIFYNTRDNSKTAWLVKGKPEISVRHGEPIRPCIRLKTGNIVMKSCKIAVEKIAYKKVYNERTKF